MKSITHPLWLLAALVLSSCGESNAPSAAGDSSGSPGEPSLVTKAKDLTHEAITSVEKLDWEGFKNKITQADLTEAKKALNGIDISAAKAKYDELAEALTKKDYVQAEFYAKQFDTLLSSDVAGRAIEFLKLESEKGTDAAIKAVREYLNTPGLGQSSREFGEKMLGCLQSVEQEQVEVVLCFIVYHAVDSKIQTSDPHLKHLPAHLAVIAVSKGFDAYDLHTKEGMELSDAIIKSLGMNKEEAATAWNDIVAASKKGTEAVKNELSKEGTAEKFKNGLNSLVESGKKLLSEEKNIKLDEATEGGE